MANFRPCPILSAYLTSSDLHTTKTTTISQKDASRVLTDLRAGQPDGGSLAKA
jgi:hypothetical protein